MITMITTTRSTDLLKLWILLFNTKVYYIANNFDQITLIFWIFW